MLFVRDGNRVAVHGNADFVMPGIGQCDTVGIGLCAERCRDGVTVLPDSVNTVVALTLNPVVITQCCLRPGSGEFGGVWNVEFVGHT